MPDQICASYAVASRGPRETADEHHTVHAARGGWEAWHAFADGFRDDERPRVLGGDWRCGVLRVQAIVPGVGARLFIIRPAGGAP